jgi:hypothetical protein
VIIIATGYWFGKAILNAFGGETEAETAVLIDYLTDTIKVALFTDAHAPDQDVDEFYDAAHGMTEVANGNGYTTGGATLGTKTLGYTAGTNVIMFDAANVTWSTSTITARYAVIYDSTPASNKPMLGYVDFGTNQSSSNGDFTITWDTEGVLKITVS